MSSHIRRILDMVLRVLSFSRANPSDDGGHTAALARLEERAARLQALVAQQQAGRTAVRAAVIAKQELRRTIQDALLLLRRVAVTATREEPETVVRLPIPRPNANQQAFLTGARVAVAEARERREILGRYGLDPGLLDELSALLDRYEAVIGEKNAGTSQHVGASAELDAVALEIMALVRLLDAINRRRFRADPERMAQWRSARDVPWPARVRGEPRPPGGPLESAA